MGEAANRRRRLARLLKEQPNCIYCGEPADTVEHMPPIQMFRLRQRPSGMEFSACWACNNGTSLSDLVASLLGRTYPDWRDDELKKLLESVSQNAPGLLADMMVTESEEVRARGMIPNMPRGAALLRADGPQLQNHMRIFGAKLGFAVHYEELRQIIPRGGGVQAFYFTNANAARGELPREVIDLLPGPPKTLRQGIKHVSNQFGYSWKLTEDGRHNVVYAVFNDAFAILAVTALDRSVFLSKHADLHPVIAPGDFKNGRQLPGQ
jgi:hypothetical protein